jgi:biotin-dependent carboxylase-like uncharacterized protein
MNTFLVLTPGSYTTVQDNGRYGYQQMGVPVSGALDLFSFKIANFLVGNPEGCAGLEVSIAGPRLAVLKEADVSLAGADMEAKLNSKPVEPWTSFRVTPGDVLSFYQVRSGCRAYMAVTGGIDTPEVMGSRATYAGGRFGGYHGRPLKKGDILKGGKGRLLNSPKYLHSEYRPRYLSEIVLRAIAGPQDFYFREGLAIFFQSVFSVSTRSDRMGYRLTGPEIVQREDMPKSIISEPSMPGGIQISPDRQPIILLVEQTMGGYAKIATVISTDIPNIAQAIPGDSIQFEKVSLETAHVLYREQQNRMLKIAKKLAAQ